MLLRKYIKETNMTRLNQILRAVFYFPGTLVWGGYFTWNDFTFAWADSLRLFWENYDKRNGFC